MKACHTYEPLIAGMLFGALSAEDQERLEAHLETCAGCRALVGEAQATLRFTAARTRPEPGAAFWDGYYDRLEARMERQAVRPAWTDRLAAWWRETGRPHIAAVTAPAWRLQLAAAVAFLATGVLIGWLVFGPSASEAPRVVREAGVEPIPVQAASLEARASRYLERSKVLLLGLVNLEPAQQDAALLDLPRKQEIARELIEESDTLRAELTEANQRLLRALIDDLEVILLQIANLEAEHDLPAIDMVRRGVESRAVLLKINLTEMRRADASLQPAVVRSLPDTSTF